MLRSSPLRLLVRCRVPHTRLSLCISADSPLLSTLAPVACNVGTDLSDLKCHASSGERRQLHLPNADVALGAVIERRRLYYH